MNLLTKVIFFGLSLSLLFGSCSKRKEFSEVPEISLRSFKTFNDSASVILKFTDGDGDIGQKDNDTVPPYNMFVKYYEKRNGIFNEVILPAPFNYRIPLLNPSGRNKAMQGEIHLDVTPSYYNPLSKYDTIRFEFYIWDRAGHESNHVNSNDVVRRVSKEWQ